MPPLPEPEGRPRFARARDALGRVLAWFARAESGEAPDPAAARAREDVEDAAPRARSSPRRAPDANASRPMLVVRRERILGLVLLRESTSRAGRAHGPEVWHSLRGDARRRIDWRDGVPHGAWREWHGNGVKALECTLENGVLHGRASAWRRDGSKHFQGEYREGRKTGEWFYLHADGKLDRERTGLYVDGERLSGIKGFNEWLGSP